VLLVASLLGWGQPSATAAHQVMAYLAMHACQYAVWCIREYTRLSKRQPLSKFVAV
jgi:hypothetical protein